MSYVALPKYAQKHIKVISRHSWNTQNDWLYAINRTKKANIAFSRLLCTCLTFTKSVMVLVTMSKIGFIFQRSWCEAVDSIIGMSYMYCLNKCYLLLNTSRPLTLSTAEQNRTSAHWVHNTVQMLQLQTLLNFLSLHLWFKQPRAECYWWQDLVSHTAALLLVTSQWCWRD